MVTTQTIDGINRRLLTELHTDPRMGIAELARRVEMSAPAVSERVQRLISTYLHACGKHRLVVPVWTPGRAARVFRSGANLAPNRAVGRRTWEDALEERVISLTESALRA